MKNAFLIAACLLGLDMAGAAPARTPDYPVSADMVIPHETRAAVAGARKPVAPGQALLATTIVDAPVQKLCSIIQDYADYPNFMAHTRPAVSPYSAQDHWLLDMGQKLALGGAKKYRLEMAPKISRQSCLLLWKLVPLEELTPEETVDRTAGYWQLIPKPDNRNQTVVEYYVYANSGSVPFGVGRIDEIVNRDVGPRIR